MPTNLDQTELSNTLTSRMLLLSSRHISIHSDSSAKMSKILENGTKAKKMRRKNRIFSSPQSIIKVSYRLWSQKQALNVKSATEKHQNQECLFVDTHYARSVLEIQF